MDHQDRPPSPPRNQNTSGQKGKKGGITWDEKNLEENERIKKELNPRKIEEPKTPYHRSPWGTDDEAEVLLERSGIEPLTLNEADFSEARLTRIQTTRHNSPWSDNSTGTSPSPHGSNSARSAGRSPRFSVEYYREGSDEDGNDDDSTLEKRRKFKEMRKSHYQMKDAMRRAKELLSKENED